MLRETSEADRTGHRIYWGEVMDLFKPFRRCFSCGGKSTSDRRVPPGELKRVHNGTIYDEHWRYYHESCLWEVLRNPENYSKTVVDQALEIESILRDEESRRQNELTQRRSQLNRARHCARIHDNQLNNLPRIIDTATSNLHEQAEEVRRIYRLDMERKRVQENILRGLGIPENLLQTHPNSESKPPPGRSRFDIIKADQPENTWEKTV